MVRVEDKIAKRKAGFKAILDGTEYVKQGHWIWWVFPTTREGKNEPINDEKKIKSYISEDIVRAPGIFEKEFLGKEGEKSWKGVLELFCDVIKQENHIQMDWRNGYTTIIPPEDRGRIWHFVQLWKTRSEKPSWLVTKF